MKTKPLINPQRKRHIERPFGWVAHALLRHPAWQQQSVAAKLLYCVLCVICDRNGQSFYGDERLSHLTSLSLPSLADARHDLLHADLIAYQAESNLVQLLSLPQAVAPPIAAPKTCTGHPAVVGGEQIPLTAVTAAEVKKLIAQLKGTLSVQPLDQG